MSMRRKGFTLVELNLAILFVALLVLGVAMTTIYVTRIYQKGLTTRTINQIGRDVNGQLRRDISSARPSQIKVALSEEGNWGRICLGSVSYIYNTAQGIAEDKVIGNGIFLARTQDPSGEWCQQGENPGDGYVKNDFDEDDSYTELLTNDVIPLAIHKMDIKVHEMNADSGKQHIYRLSMQLGTNEAETTTSDGKCLPPTESTANFDHCFIAEFETIIRSGEVQI